MEVLVLEDDLIQLSYFSKIVESMEHNFIFCSTAKSAIEEVESKKFDVVFLDLAMPDEDGFDVVRTLSKFSPMTAIVFVSSSANRILQGSIFIAKNLGVQRVKKLNKPIYDYNINSMLKWVEITNKDNEGINVTINSTKQIIPYYQAIICPKSLSILAVEICPKLKNSENEIVNNDALFTISCSDNIDVTRYIIDSGLNDFLHFLKVSPSLRLSINVSHKDLSNRTFVKYIFNKVDGLGIDTSNIIIEVTEKEFNLEQNEVLENLCRLNIMGFNISMDGFGIGYSTVSTLISGIFNEVKINIDYFQKSICDDKYKYALNGVIKFAEELELNVVCCGVETYGQYKLVANYSESSLQGGLLFKCLNFNDMLDVLSSHKFKGNTSYGGKFII